MISNGKYCGQRIRISLFLRKKGIIFRYFFKDIPNFKNHVLKCNKKHVVGQLFENNFAATRQASTLWVERSWILSG
jgi:hypothetical protein